MDVTCIVLDRGGYIAQTSEPQTGILGGADGQPQEKKRLYQNISSPWHPFFDDRRAYYVDTGACFEPAVVSSASFGSDLWAQTGPGLAGRANVNGERGFGSKSGA